MDIKIWKMLVKAFLLGDLIILVLEVRLYFFSQPLKIATQQSTHDVVYYGNFFAAYLVVIRFLSIMLTLWVLYRFINSFRKRTGWEQSFFLLFFSALVLNNLHHVIYYFAEPMAIILLRAIETFLLFFAVIVISRHDDKEVLKSSAEKQEST